jgi:hypothetical protein
VRKWFLVHDFEPASILDDAYVCCATGVRFAKPRRGASTQSSATFVYVGQQNAQNGAGKIAGFKVNSDGSSQPTPSSPYTGSGSGLALSPAGDILFGSDYSNVESWAVGSDGALSRQNDLAGVFGNLLMIDNSGHTLYAQEFYIGGTGNNDYAFLNIGSNGALQKIGATRRALTVGGSSSPRTTRAHMGPSAITSTPALSDTHAIQTARSRVSTRMRRFQPTTDKRRSAPHLLRCRPMASTLWPR